MSLPFMVAQIALRLVTDDVNAAVEPVVIPVGLMVAAPLAVLVHSGPVMLNLAALLAVTRYVVVDAGPICFQPVVAFVSVVRANGVSESERKPTR